MFVCLCAVTPPVCVCLTVSVSVRVKVYPRCYHLMEAVDAFASVATVTGGCRCARLMIRLCALVFVEETSLSVLVRLSVCRCDWLCVRGCRHQQVSYGAGTTQSHLFSILSWDMITVISVRRSLKHQLSTSRAYISS